MLIKFLKYFLGIVIFIGFVILVLLTFFSSDTKKTNLDNIFIQTSYTGTFINKLNSIDRIYSLNKDSFSYQEKDGEININLEKGLYILDLGDLSKKYTINHSSFVLDLIVPGDIFIDTSDNYITIFSINSSFDLNFLNKKGDVVNSLFLYPHEIYKFNPRFVGISIKNTSDIYRLKTINKLSFKPYIKYKLVNFDFSNLGLYFSNKSIKKLFDNFIKNKNLEILTNNKNLLNFLNLKIIYFPFYDFIIENKTYFINNFKKSVFLQNTIYNIIISLFKDDNYGEEKLNKIKLLLGELKQIDTKSYNETKKFIDDIYKLIIYQNKLSDYKKLKVLLALESEKNDFEKNINFLNLKNIYFNYDFLENVNFKKDFDLFLKKYLKQSGITKKDEEFLLNDRKVLKQVESFVFYLKEYIDNHLFYDDLKNFGYEVDILSQYIPLNKMIYFSGEKVDYKIRTSLKENRKLLEKMEKFLRKNFFLESRDSNGLLLLDKSKNYNNKDFQKLKKQVESIFFLYRQNKKYLKESDKEDVKGYNLLFQKITEEFKAISHYENYKLEYDKGLYSLSTVKGTGEETTYNYTIADIKKYLNFFDNFYYGTIEKKENYFIVNDVQIEGKDYIFYLFPIGHKIDVYNLKGQFLFSLGSLDIKKEIWDEKYKGVKEEDKYKYDFKNFFYLTFISNKNYNNKTQEEICREIGKIVDPNDNTKCIEKNQDSAVIMALKQKLLKKEFNILKNFFFIKYDNINIIQDDNGDYKIEIINVPISINVKNKLGETNYKLIFSSNYNYANHYFYNISLSIKEKNNYLFQANKIYLSPQIKINIDNIQNYLLNFLKNINYLKNVYSILNLELYITNIKIYYTTNNVFNIGFTINTKNIDIILEKNLILSILVNNSNILEEPINIGDLKNYINKLQ